MQTRLHSPQLLQHNLEMWAGQRPVFCLLWQMREWLSAAPTVTEPVNEIKDRNLGSQCATLWVCGGPLHRSPMHGTGILPDSVQLISNGQRFMSCTFHFQWTLDSMSFPSISHLGLTQIFIKAPFLSNFPMQTCSSIQVPCLTHEPLKMTALLLRALHQIPPSSGSPNWDIWEESLSGSQKVREQPESWRIILIRVTEAGGGGFSSWVFIVRAHVRAKWHFQTSVKQKCKTTWEQQRQSLLIAYSKEDKLGEILEVYQQK